MPRARPVVVALAVSSVLFAAAAFATGGARPVTGDDALILLVSDRLARDGVLGSPLFEGFHGAGTHYFLNLPLLHVLHAAVFRLAGAGMTQARVVSVAGALLVLWSAVLLAWRAAGGRAAAVTLGLLLFWRSGLAGLDPGLPLFGSARSARYDIVAVGFAWLAVLFLEAQLRRPRARTAIAVGLAAGAACLTQFHGAFVLPGLAAAWFTLHARTRERWSHALLALGGGIAVVLPYLLYFARHAADAAGQIRAVHSERMAGGPAALFRSVLAEPLRFFAATEFRGAGPWLLLVGIAPAFVLMAHGARRQPGARTLVLVVTASIVLCLALIEHTKAPLYALPLLPAACIAFALVFAGVPGSRMIRPRRHGDPQVPQTTGAGDDTPSGSLPRIGAALVLVAVVAEGVVTLGRTERRRDRATPYAGIVARLEAALPAGAAIAGSARWSWGLREHPYTDFRVLSLLRREAPRSGGTEGLLSARGVRYVIVDDDLRASASRPDFYGAEFLAEWSRYLVSCTEAGPELHDDTYGSIEVRAVRPCPGPAPVAAPAAGPFHPAARESRPSGIAAAAPAS